MKFLERKRNRILVLIFFWTCLMGSISISLFSRDGVPSNFIYRNFIYFFAASMLTLINANWLFPNYFQTRRYGRYALATSAVLLGFVLLHAALADMIRTNIIQPQLNNLPFPRRPQEGAMLIDPRRVFDFVFYTAVIMAGTVLESVQLHRRQEHEASQVKNEKLETEMKFLKSQINPHFLFNVLNNVYTLSLIKSDQTPEVVMKLSEMLRYVLYECNQPRVSLRQEKQYIDHYIELQQLKDEIPLAIASEFHLHNSEEPIAPMILIPFVENAFKHSKIEDTQKGWIKIRLVSDAHTIDFRISNSVATSDFTKDPTGGIGLNNVKRRLELEYPHKYQLEINRSPQQFSVHLLIQLV